MSVFRGKILWVDDEVNHLKPHILFLKEKGYSITDTTNGSDAIDLISKESFDLVLLDQFMPGMDGLTTLREMKEIKPTLPVIMITKSEEEDLMDEAISEKVAQFLIKPVNPTQIFMACKQVLEKAKIREEKATRKYLQDFQILESKIQNDLTFEEWCEVYSKLTKWQIEFDEHPEISLKEILNEQHSTANKMFVRFIESNYKNWLSTEQRPTLSNDVFKTFVSPIIEENNKLCFLVIDALRYDQFLTIMEMISVYFEFQIDFHISLLPTATPFCRNAIFSGLFPDEFVKKFPLQLKNVINEEDTLNQHEEAMLRAQLNRYGFESKSMRYEKINTAEYGKKFLSRFPEYKNLDILALVINFVDILGHIRAESDIIKEIVPDEIGYRSAIKSWFEHSWLYSLLRELSKNDYKIVLTSDHGSTVVNKGVLVGANKEASDGLRYKVGRNLNTNDKHALIIRQPSAYRLFEIMHETTYVIAKENVFFLYPNQQHYFEKKLTGSFQHGGITMEEMIVPVVTMKSKLG